MDRISEIEAIRKEYDRQRKIEAITTSRPLTRPKTTRLHVVVCLLIFVCLVVLSVALTSMLTWHWTYKALFLSLLLLTIVEVYLRACLIVVVKCYQHYAGTEVRRTCKCVPSCSEYAICALKTRFPLVWALLKIRRRLYVTCDGKDYVVDFPTKKMTDAFNATL